MSCNTGFFNVRRGWQSLNTGPRFYLRLIRRTGWLWISTFRTTDGRPFKPKKLSVPFLYPRVPAGLQGIKKSTSCTYISVTIVFIALKQGIKKSTSCTYMYISVTIVFIALKQGVKKSTSCTYISVTIVYCIEARNQEIYKLHRHINNYCLLHWSKESRNLQVAPTYQ
jgi:putative lipoic acid-binding regulatory protein